MVASALRSVRETGNQLNQKEWDNMPLFLDTHKGMDGLTAEAAAGVHMKDVETQAKHGVKYLKYWFSAAEGTVHCLFEAPNKEAGEAVPREAHGMMADEITEVQEGE